jgi:hypothetical protein
MVKEKSLAKIVAQGVRLNATNVQDEEKFNVVNVRVKAILLVPFVMVIKSVMVKLIALNVKP